MYVLPASKKCRASWPIKFIKGARPGVTVQQMQKKDLKEKRPEQIFNAKWCKGRPWTWLKYDHDENVMTCTKYGSVQIRFLIKKTLGETEPSRYTFTINLTSRHKQTWILRSLDLRRLRKKKTDDHDDEKKEKKKQY
jgi:hypothetical protein